MFLGILKRQKKWGGDFGVFGRPTPPPGGRAGSEDYTLLPMTMTCDRLKCWNGPAWLGGQKLSSGNLGGGRIQFFFFFFLQNHKACLIIVWVYCTCAVILSVRVYMDTELR